MGLQRPGWPYVLGMPPRGDVRHQTPRARATDVGQGPHLRPGVPAGSLRATEPEAREKTRGRKTKKCRSASKANLYIVVSVVFHLLYYSYSNIYSLHSNVTAMYFILGGGDDI